MVGGVDHGWLVLSHAGGGGGAAGVFGRAWSVQVFPSHQRSEEPLEGSGYHPAGGGVWFCMPLHSYVG